MGRLGGAFLKLHTHLGDQIDFCDRCFGHKGSCSLWISCLGAITKPGTIEVAPWKSGRLPETVGR